jgi:two-component system sensor histidine kinase/response regulator
MLLNWGMHPVVADQAEAALAELRRAAAAGSRYRVALIDAMMPGMDGFELSRAIQTRPELGSPAVLMLSSGDRQDGMVRSRAVGVAYYLSKPVLQSELQAALLSALGGVSVNRERMSGILSDGASGPWTPVARPLNVLVAEDNAVNQKLFQRMLAKRGYLVTTVTSGVEVLAAVERQKFDLVLMDVQMPEMSGLEATERIRALELGTGRHLPIVALTAHAMTGDRERCLKAGMDGYISKPVQLRELFEMIDRVMTPAPSEEVPLPPAPVRVQASLDRAAVLARLDGDEELLRELVDLFLDDTPRLLAEARDAIAVGDSVRLQRAAHTIKGSVGNFGAEAVVNAAWHLESLARTTSLAEAPAGLERLAQLLEEVGPKLRQLALPKGAPLPSPELAGRAPGTNGSACRDK